MFWLGYLILLLVASIPLAMTVLRHRGDPPSAALAHRVYRDLAYIALAALAIVASETTLRIALEGAVSLTATCLRWAQETQTRPGLSP